jgi:hypothetical protein
MVTVAMVTKVQKMLNSLPTSQSFAGMFPLELPLQSNRGHHPTPLFWYLGFHGNVILNFINTPKASTHYGEYSYDVS